MINILFTSGKGGVGKTTASAQVGAAMSFMGKKILLIDGDAGLRNLDATLGVSSRIVYDAKDILEDKIEIKDAVINQPMLPNLSLIAAPHNSRYKNNDLLYICKKADKLYDICIIDCPAGIDEGFNACAICCDYIMIVTTPDVAAVRDAITTKKQLISMNKKDIWIILNKERTRMARKGGCMSKDEVEEFTGCNCIGTILDSKRIIKAGNAGEIITRGKEYNAYNNIASKIIEIIK